MIFGEVRILTGTEILYSSSQPLVNEAHYMISPVESFQGRNKAPPVVATDGHAREKVKCQVSHFAFWQQHHVGG